MQITITCPKCGKSYEVSDDRVGLLHRCACGADILVISPAKKQLQQSKTNQNQSSDPTPVAPWESSAGTNKSNPRYDPPKQSGASSQSYYNPRTGELFTPQNKTTSIPRQHGRLSSSDTDDYPRPWLLTIMIVITDILCGFGLFYLASSVVNMAPSIDKMPDDVKYNYLIQVTIIMVIYSVILSVCASLWNGYNWARLAMIVIMSIVFAGSIRAIAGPMQQYTEPLLLLMFLSVSFIVVLCTKSCRFYCGV